MKTPAEFVKAPAAFELRIGTVTRPFRIQVNDVARLVPSFDAELTRTELDGGTLRGSA